MNLLLKTGCLFFAFFVAVQGCSQSDREHSSSDPYSGLPVIKTEILLDINDQDSANAGKFYLQSKYFLDMAISGKGEYFISNVYGSSILHLNKNGEFLARIGNEGRGPGEFQTSPFFDVHYQDTLFALDRTSRMVHVFVNSNGEWFNANSFNLEQRNNVRPEGIYQLNDNQLAIEYIPNPRRLITENNEYQLRKTIDIVSDDGEKILDTLLAAPTDQQSVYTSKNGGAVIQDLPFGFKSIVDTGPGSSLYHLVTDNFLITIYNNEGQVRDSIRHSNFSIEINEDERWTAIEEAVNVTMGSSREDQAMKDQMFEEMPASTYPLSNMFVDRDTGHVIVKRSEMYDGANWLLLDPEGNCSGIFSLTETLEVFDFRNGKIIGALMSEEDDILPTIRVVSLNI